jgi:hypothetical protein
LADEAVAVVLFDVGKTGDGLARDEVGAVGELGSRTDCPAT